MVVRIEDTCTACGLCCDTCPEVFEMNDDMAQVIVDEANARSRPSSSSKPPQDLCCSIITNGSAAGIYGLRLKSPGCGCLCD
ncbi:MAG: ferredoxin [Planctomycetota bacterium]